MAKVPAENLLFSSKAFHTILFFFQSNIAKILFEEQITFPPIVSQWMVPEGPKKLQITLSFQKNHGQVSMEQTHINSLSS
jgi:hypothetical protein